MGCVILQLSGLILAIMGYCSNSSAGIPHNQESLASFTVHSGDHQRINTPVSVDVTGLLSENRPEQMELVEHTADGTKVVPFQIEADNSVSLLWWVLEGETPAGTTRTYKLYKKNTGSTFQSISTEDTGEAIHFLSGEGQKILAYHYALTPVPEGVDEIYRRAGYIHPLWSPAGEVLTRIQPPDHYHHYGIWNPWTHTEFEGKEIDFWNLIKGQATVVVNGKPMFAGGPVYGQLRSLHQHLVKKDSLSNSDKVALNEIWDIRVWNQEAQPQVWLVDFSSTLSCASESPLTIKEYRYQGFGFRANKNWDDQTAQLITSEGKNKADGNGTRARWCNVNGPGESGRFGIVFITNPANYNFPEQLRIWPVGTNEGKENVFVNFNPAQDRDWILEPGHLYTLRYRMVIYDGDSDHIDAEQYWNDYINPPMITRQ